MYVSACALIKSPSVQSVLNEGIANFYDESSGLWESMWGEHMHHGYYPKGAAPKSNQEAQIDMIEEVLSWAGATSATKVRKIGPSLSNECLQGVTATLFCSHASLCHFCCRYTTESLACWSKWLFLQIHYQNKQDIEQYAFMQMVDVGCGIGGSSRHIARKFGCTAQGITLSPVQVLTGHLSSQK